MCHYTHLSVEEREDIMCFKRDGKSISEIARLIHRDKSTVSREFNRNICCKGRRNEYYRASTAQKLYIERRKRCVKPFKLEHEPLFKIVMEKLIVEQWSPEQIEGRLRLEQGFLISASTIYRAIESGVFDNTFLFGKAKKHLRHRGKKRKKKGSLEKRGKIKISHTIDERPQEANERTRKGDWEGDTVAGKQGGPCLVTLVDRTTRYLVGGKVRKKLAKPVRKAMIKYLKEEKNQTITLDRGKEFAEHEKVSDALKIKIYFAAPHHPWQRGTNENTNGLIRQYFPKGCDLRKISEKDIEKVYDKLNRRPRKSLGYRTPYEAYFGEVLHLV